MKTTATWSSSSFCSGCCASPGPATTVQPAGAAAESNRKSAQQPSEQRSDLWRQWHGVSLAKPDWAAWSRTTATSLHSGSRGALLWMGSTPTRKASVLRCRFLPPPEAGDRHLCPVHGFPGGAGQLQRRGDSPRAELRAAACRRRNEKSSAVIERVRESNPCHQLGRRSYHYTTPAQYKRTTAPRAGGDVSTRSYGNPPAQPPRDIDRRIPEGIPPQADARLRLHAGTGLAAQLGFYLFPFFTCDAGLPAFIAGSLLTVIKVWDVLNDPLIGWLSVTESRWGPACPGSRPQPCSGHQPGGDVVVPRGMWDSARPITP